MTGLVHMPTGTRCDTVAALVAALRLAESEGAAKRLIAQRAVSINGTVVCDEEALFSAPAGSTAVHVGHRTAIVVSGDGSRS
jgi:tyrosyl-tRNA synthetase